MKTQTFAQAQDFTAINDDELIAVNGGGLGSLAKLGGKAFRLTRNQLAFDAATDIVGGAING